MTTLFDLFHSPEARILDYMIANPYSDASINEVKEKTGIKMRTLQRHMPALRQAGILELSRTVGRNTHMYKLSSNQLITSLKDFVNQLPEIKMIQAR